MTERNEQFDQHLDELYPAVSMAGVTLSPSSILFRTDPIAYREALIDFIDWMDDEQDSPEELLADLDYRDNEPCAECGFEGAGRVHDGLAYCLDCYSEVTAP